MRTKSTQIFSPPNDFAKSVSTTRVSQNEKENFAARLREARGVESARSFAARVGIIPQALSRYESGKGNLPGADILKRFCYASGVSADWLLGLSEIKTRKEVEDARNADLEAAIAKQAASIESLSRAIDAALTK